MACWQGILAYHSATEVDVSRIPVQYYGVVLDFLSDIGAANTGLLAGHTCFKSFTSLLSSCTEFRAKC